MPISAPVNAAARIRLLAREHRLAPLDIARLTGYPMKNVRAALGAGEKADKPKSRAIEARGPLTAEQVSTRLGITVESARRVTG